MPALETPTSQWLAAVPELPTLTGPADTAERLLLLLHYSINWDSSWVASHRRTYWDRTLPDRVVVASWRAHDLRAWWCAMIAELDATPRNAPERREIEQLLRADPYPVLQVLRGQTEALLLRTRIVAEARRKESRE